MTEICVSLHYLILFAHGAFYSGSKKCLLFNFLSKYFLESPSAWTQPSPARTAARPSSTLAPVSSSGPRRRPLPLTRLKRFLASLYSQCRDGLFFSSIFFIKNGPSSASFCLFSVFTSLQLLNKLMWKNVHPVYCAGIWTHDLSNMSCLP